MKIKIQGIYKILNIISDKVYIGQSIDIESRFSAHKHCALKVKEKHPLYDSIRKYGIQAFEFIIFEKVDNILQLDEREQYWINYYKSNNKNYGYNLRLDCTNNRGCKLSEESRKIFSNRQKKLCQDTDYIKNLSEKSKENWKNKEWRDNCLAKQKEVTRTLEYRKQNSERTKSLWQNSEYRNKMLEARKHSEIKRIQTIEDKKLSDSTYLPKIIEQRRQTQVKKGIIKIHLIDKNKVKQLYLEENYRLQDVAKLLKVSYGLLSKFVKINGLQKPKFLYSKVKPKLVGVVSA